MDVATGRIFRPGKWYSRLLLDEFNYPAGLLKDVAPAWSEFDNDASATVTADPRITVSNGDCIGSGATAVSRSLYQTSTLGLPQNYSFAFTAALRKAHDSFTYRLHLETLDNIFVASTKLIGMYVQAQMTVDGQTDCTVAVWGGATTTASILNVYNSDTRRTEITVRGQMLNRTLSASFTVAGSNATDTAAASGSTSVSVAAAAYNSSRRNVGFFTTWPLAASFDKHFFERVEIAPGW